jgi:hypothetical protein
MMMDSFATTTAKLFGDGCNVQTKGPGRKQTRQKLERQKGERERERETLLVGTLRTLLIGTLRSLPIGTLPSRFLLLSPY